jgi:hypothetical protein
MFQKAISPVMPGPVVTGSMSTFSNGSSSPVALSRMCE